MSSRFNTRRQVALLAILLAGHTMSHAGDGTVARLVRMSGSVLVSNDSTIAAAGEGLRLMPGARVLTTSNAAVVVKFDDGCDVKIEPSQRFVVPRAAPCSSVAAQPQSFGVRLVAARP